ncbi:helix-turn-helix transcriptional regulator [Mesorhizobium sp. B2-4-16]|nr:helix-turn-helix transcriptional regulator [Mesorhizobium sp. B2-4-16]TPL60619.1 helix-turn-helix transcriptional regulator [Mesorhizobium sp. B2-4-3]
MNPTEKALWFVESHLPDAISLDEIAASSGVSRFHVTRAFGAATGRSVMGYMRARRLSEAARKLAGGAPDILSVALDAGYGFHAGLSRCVRHHGNGGLGSGRRLRVERLPSPCGRRKSAKAPNPRSGQPDPCRRNGGALPRPA